jgi:hypothetical protein
MSKEFIPYEEVLALKELGFDEDCLKEVLYVNDKFGDFYAPLYQQAFRWFREECNLLHIINIDLSDNLKDKVYVYSIEDHLGSIVDRSEEFKTYEEAELACLKKLIEIVKNKESESNN